MAKDFDFRMSEDLSQTEFVGTCGVTGEKYSVTIKTRDYLEWKVKGQKVQDVFPHLTPGQREFMMSGFTPAEWDAMAAEEEAARNQEYDEDVPF